MQRLITLAAGLGIALHCANAAEDVAPAAEAVMKRSFTRASAEEWKARLAQDPAQALCSQHRNQPPAEVASQIIAEQLKTIQYPQDGKLVGDWREGEKLASSGRGGHIGRMQPDASGVRRGGNCYACHALAPKEVAFGTLGPSLTKFGKLRGNSPETVKYTYDKIFNAQAFYACSNMPRFGYHQWLSPEEIAHTVAFLLDPESPVNK